MCGLESFIIVLRGCLEDLREGVDSGVREG